MTEQMTQLGILVLLSAIVVFWGTIVILVRAHRAHGRRHAATAPHAAPLPTRPHAPARARHAADRP